MRIYRLENVIQTYAWGSNTAIADLLGLPAPSAQPQAELWMGTHPKGPSRVKTEAGSIPLQQLIERQPLDILGKDVLLRFGPVLPFLFKVLAAARPLSIQAHPSKSQALAGFNRENHAGKALDAPDRNYKDANHKPEIICALTPFWALNGFRPIAEAVDLLTPVCPHGLNDAFQELKQGSGEGLRTFLKAMLTLPDQQRQAGSREVVDKARSRAKRSTVYGWMVKLANAYPADMGMLSPALFNLVRLDPGQAMFLPSGQLHAYLDGVGIELMANSDNVLRGGLTPKHVDVPELLSVVRFEDGPVDRLEAMPQRATEAGFACPAVEFSLSILRPTAAIPYTSPLQRRVEILLCIAGGGRIEVCGKTDSLEVRKGDSFLVPAGLACYRIDGNATLYKATVPPADQ